MVDHSKASGSLCEDEGCPFSAVGHIHRGVVGKVPKGYPLPVEERVRIKTDVDVCGAVARGEHPTAEVVLSPGYMEGRSWS
jgi:hypothetical protein